MKKYYRYGIALVGIAFLASSGMAFAEEEGGEHKTEASVTVGVSWNDTDRNDTMAAEYESLADKDAWVLGGFSLFNESEKSEFSIEGSYLDDDDMDFEGELDINRIIGIDAAFTKFYHRLPQDELLNMRATSAAPGQGAQLWHSYEYAPEWDVNSDTAPDHEFGVSWSEWEATGLIRLPSVPGLKMGVSVREQVRKGHEQAMAMSKCGSCHIVSHDKTVDEKTWDIKPFIKADLGQLSLEYNFLYRRFVNDNDAAYNLYDPATHPFDASSSKYGSVNYDYRDGPLQIDRAPETEKYVNTFKAKYDVDATQNIYASFINAKTTNSSVDELTRVADGGSDSELDVKYNAGLARWSAWVSDALKLNLSGRYQNIDADDATYTLKGTTSDPADDITYLRESDESRDVISLKLNALYRLNTDVTLRGGYEYENINRDNAHFLVDQDTDTHTFNAKARWRAARGLKLNLSYKFVYQPDPYTIEDAAYPEHVDLGVNDEGNWDGYINNPVTGEYAVDAARTPQKYFYNDYVYGMRTDNMSADPEYDNDIKFKVNWIPTDMNMFVDGYMKFNYGTNDKDLEYSYKDQVIDTGVDVTYNPMEILSVTFGYNYFSRHTDSEFYIPYYHG